MKDDKRIGKRYSHWFGISGILIKITRPVGQVFLFHIRCANGAVFMAPGKEFEEVE